MQVKDRRSVTKTLTVIEFVVALALSVMVNKVSELLKIPSLVTIIVAVLLVVLSLVIRVTLLSPKRERKIRGAARNSLWSTLSRLSPAFPVSFAIGAAIAFLSIYLAPYRDYHGLLSLRVMDYEITTAILSLVLLCFIGVRSRDSKVTLAFASGLALGISAAVLGLRPHENIVTTTLICWMALLWISGLIFSWSAFRNMVLHCLGLLRPSQGSETKALSRRHDSVTETVLEDRLEDATVGKAYGGSFSRLGGRKCYVLSGPDARVVYGQPLPREGMLQFACYIPEGYSSEGLLICDANDENRSEDFHVALRPDLCAEFNYKPEDPAESRNVGWKRIGAAKLSTCNWHTIRVTWGLHGAAIFVDGASEQAWPGITLPLHRVSTRFGVGKVAEGACRPAAGGVGIRDLLVKRF